MGANAREPNVYRANNEGAANGEGADTRLTDNERFATRDLRLEIVFDQRPKLDADRRNAHAPHHWA